jgi:diphthamide synthase (EF-2-diphthine--ammonia ligase)
MNQQEQLLSRFNGDPHTKEALINFMEAHFQAKIIESAIAKLPTESLADAIIEMKQAFEDLENMYDIKQALRGDRDTNTAK